MAEHTLPDDRHVWMNLARVIGVLCAIAAGLIVAVKFIA
jgi:hypothetical protein